MSLISQWLTTLLLLVMCGGAEAAKDPLATIKLSPMKFYLAKGGPASCGPGCSEWIAAAGDIDPEAHIRFRKFLWSLPDKRKPVFFASRGGSLGASRAIGNFLREYDMTAAVGRTVFEPRRKQHRLDFNGVRCASACVYALIGASRRQVADRARVGVHASVWKTPAPQPSAEQVELLDNSLRNYVISNGVDAGLVDLSVRTPNKSMHWLSRAELVRFGITGAGTFETRWRLLRTAGGYKMLKSVSRDERSDRQTSTIEISCQFPGTVNLAVGRDIGDDEPGHWVVRLRSGPDFVWESLRSQHELRNLRATSARRIWTAKTIAIDPLVKPTADRALVLEQRFVKAGQPGPIQEERLSGQSFQQTLAEMLRHCGNVLPQRGANASVPR